MDSSPVQGVSAAMFRVSLSADGGRLAWAWARGKVALKVACEMRSWSLRMSWSVMVDVGVDEAGPALGSSRRGWADSARD